MRHLDIAQVVILYDHDEATRAGLPILSCFVLQYCAHVWHHSHLILSHLPQLD